MKKVFINVPLFIILVLISCHEASDSQGDNKTGNNLDASVGQQITLETANRWMDLYKSKNDHGRTNGKLSYSVKAAQLEQLVKAVKSPTGVSFHHAIDDTGAYHILVSAISNPSTLWSSPIVIDANTNTVIETTKASSWANKFKEANPSQIWYHFFGINLIKEIIADKGFNYLDIEPALNDALAPQLLLVVWNNKNNEPGGRTMVDDPKVYDNSKPCPPCTGS